MRKSYDAKSLKNASFRKRQTPTTVRVGGQTYNKSDRSQVALAVEVEQLSLQGLTTLPPRYCCWISQCRIWPGYPHKFDGTFGFDECVD